MNEQKTENNWGYEDRVSQRLFFDQKAIIRRWQNEWFIWIKLSYLDDRIYFRGKKNWMNEWTNERMNKWMNEWMNEWMNKWKWMWEGMRGTRGDDERCFMQFYRLRYSPTDMASYGRPSNNGNKDVKCKL